MMSVVLVAGARTQGGGSHDELCLEQVLPLAGDPIPPYDTEAPDGPA